MAERKDVHLGLRLPKDQVDQLRGIAERLDVTMSQLFRYSVKKYVLDVEATKPVTFTDLYGS